MTLCITADFQTNSCLPARCRSRLFSSSRRDSFTVFSTVTSSFSVESGFSRKSTAPRRVARTAISMLAWPEIITTGAVDAGRFQIGQQREPVLARHHDIGKNHVEALRFREFQRAIGLIAHHRLMPGQPKRPRQRRQRVRVVIHQQQFAHAVASARFEMSCPCPARCVRVMVPL